MSIYHMIKEEKEFQPIDYEQVVTRKQSKELNLKNVIAFLGERGIDEKTLRMVEKQCWGDKSDDEGTKSVEVHKGQKKKQPKSDTETKPTKRRGRPPKSTQAKAQPLDQHAVATA